LNLGKDESGGLDQHPHLLGNIRQDGKKAISTQISGVMIHHHRCSPRRWFAALDAFPRFTRRDSIEIRSSGAAKPSPRPNSGWAIDLNIASRKVNATRQNKRNLVEDGGFGK